MTKYIEYFQVEAKCLLKDFKKTLPEAKSRCEKYFKGREISLLLYSFKQVLRKGETKIFETKELMWKKRNAGNLVKIVKKGLDFIEDVAYIVRKDGVKNPFLF